MIQTQKLLIGLLKTESFSGHNMNSYFKNTWKFWFAFGLLILIVFLIECFGSDQNDQTPKPIEPKDKKALVCI